jgi:hypothetical protein
MVENVSLRGVSLVIPRDLFPFVGLIKNARNKMNAVIVTSKKEQAMNTVNLQTIVNVLAVSTNILMVSSLFADMTDTVKKSMEPVPTVILNNVRHQRHANVYLFVQMPIQA